MGIVTAKQQTKDTVRAYMRRDAGMYIIPPVQQRPMFLVGAPGIDKTAIIEQIAQELGVGVVSYSMTRHMRQSARASCSSTRSTASRKRCTRP